MYRLIFLLCSLLVLGSCKNFREREVAAVDLEIVRYDQWQYEATEMNSFSALQQMNTEAPLMTQLLYEDVLGIGPIEDIEINERFLEYFSDSVLRQIIRDSEQKFADVSDIEKELNYGFGVLRKEIPSLPIPRIYSIISALNQSIVVGNDILAFSIDKYLGSDYPLYARYYYPHQRRGMVRDRIVIDCLKYYLLAQFPYNWGGQRRTLGDMILYRGKIGWMIKQCLKRPYKNSEIMGYSEEEARWCEENRENMIGWLSHDNLLQSTNMMLIRELTQESPQPLINEHSTPPLIAVWMGIELVDRYIKAHPKTTMLDLLTKEDINVELSELLQSHK